MTQSNVNYKLGEAQPDTLSMRELEELLAYHNTDLETFSEDFDYQEEWDTNKVMEWLGY